MCGRYTLTTDLDALQLRFSFDASGVSHTPQYNVAPTQEVLAVINESGVNKGDHLRWGLIPSWAKDPSVGHRMINARGEAVAERPSFSRSLANRRCLILADGFYEWEKEAKSRVPTRFVLKSQEPFAFAGLWDLWKSPSGEWVRSCAIITTMANPLVEVVHNRMPIILPREAESLWLDQGIQDPGTLTALFSPYPAEEMESYRVSKLVNSPRYNDPASIEPVPHSNTLF